MGHEQQDEEVPVTAPPVCEGFMLPHHRPSRGTGCCDCRCSAIEDPGAQGMRSQAQGYTVSKCQNWKLPPDFGFLPLNNRTLMPTGELENTDACILPPQTDFSVPGLALAVPVRSSVSSQGGDRCWVLSPVQWPRTTSGPVLRTLSWA